MKITWIGQAGLYIETQGLKIMIDPYLSNSVEKYEPQNRRRIPVKEALFDVRPDVMIFTHDHLDHYDPETAPRFLAQKVKMTVLAPQGCWQKARAAGGHHNCVQVEPGVEWTQGGVRFIAVPAVHSDPNAIGMIIESEGRRLYITGDTLYSTKIFPQLPADIDIVFLPVNGVGNNMNMTDAARFAHACGAKCAWPLHWGMFDSIDPQPFAFEPRHIPEIYAEVEI